MNLDELETLPGATRVDDEHLVITHGKDRYTVTAVEGGWQFEQIDGRDMRGGGRGCWTMRVNGPRLHNARLLRLAGVAGY